MNALINLLQTVVAFLYTSLYTSVMYWAIMLPMSWILSLSKVTMIIVLLLFGGLLEGLISFLNFVGIFPYSWIVKDNKISLGVAISLLVILPGYSLYWIWSSFLGIGFLGVVIAIILTGMFVQYIVGSITGILALYEESDERSW